MHMAASTSIELSVEGCPCINHLLFVTATSIQVRSSPILVEHGAHGRPVSSLYIMRGFLQSLPHSRFELKETHSILFS